MIHALLAPAFQRMQEGNIFTGVCQQGGRDGRVPLDKTGVPLPPSPPDRLRAGRVPLADTQDFLVYFEFFRMRGKHLFNYFMMSPQIYERMRNNLVTQVAFK